MPRRALSYTHIWVLVFSPVWMFIGVPVGNWDPPDGSRNQQTCRVLLFVFVSRIAPCWARAVAIGVCHCCTEESVGWPILSVYRGMSAYDGQSLRTSAAVLMWGLSRCNRPVSSFFHLLSQSVGG